MNNRCASHLYGTPQSNIICEAFDCYQTATESIVVSVGKFGTINLNLCYKCAVAKFQATSNRDKSVEFKRKL